MSPKHKFSPPFSPSRRRFSKAIAAAPWILPTAALQLRGQPAAEPLNARIKVDTERVISEIDPKIYGNFTEHLGRCIEGGIFDEGSPLSDSAGYRKDVMDAAKALKVTLLRWPGGNFSSNYHWRDGIGPRDQRPARLEMAWGSVESNRFGTHEFLEYCEQLGTEPYICANLGTGTWTEVQEWVEYVNGTKDTAVTRERKANGRQDPWGVKYWALGNEMDGGWQMGHRDVVEYSKFALEAAKLMKWTDDSIKLVAAGSSNYGAGSDWIGWNETVLDFLKNHADYIALHLYVGNNQNDYLDFLTSSVALQDRIKIAEGTINSALSGSNRKIHIAWDEWNVWYRARGANSGTGRNLLEEHYNLEDALVVATFLNTFVNNSHIIKIANMAQLVNVIAPIFTSPTGMYLQTIYYPLQLFANNTKGAALDLFVESPKYKARRFDDVPYLDVSSSYEESDGTLVVNVVNRHPDREIATEIEAQDKRFTGAVEVVTVTGPDIKASNDFNRSPVTAARSTATAQGETLRYTFSPHSYTMLKTRMAG